MVSACRQRMCHMLQEFPSSLILLRISTLKTCTRTWRIPRVSKERHVRFIWCKTWSKGQLMASSFISEPLVVKKYRLLCSTRTLRRLMDFQLFNWGPTPNRSHSDRGSQQPDLGWVAKQGLTDRNFEKNAIQHPCGSRTICYRCKGYGWSDSISSA
jgi:hypothetical protein